MDSTSPHLGKLNSLSNSPCQPPSPRKMDSVPVRLQSPKKSCLLDSNNDELERAQSRAARAAAIRRKVVVSALLPPSDDPILSREQIMELFQNCIKLASENKINQKNMWELKLIDHLSEIIKVDAVKGDAETNFRKASCTLEAGVKIYSVRVDAVHKEAYKVLGGITRAAEEQELETSIVGENVENGQDVEHSTEETERKVSPLSTLESSFGSLNMKKFDVAFSADPLYHHSSAQFDEGGAKGLLLNNLGVYEGCRVLFDSLEVPGKCKFFSSPNNTSDMIDISFSKDSIEQMVFNMRAKNEISPTLKEIICHCDEDDQRSLLKFNLGQNFDPAEHLSDGSVDAFDADSIGLEENSFGDFDSWRLDPDEETVNDERHSTFYSYYKHDATRTVSVLDIRGQIENVTLFLFHGMQFTSKQNAWAGAAHWKYRKFTEDVSIGESGCGFKTRTQKKKSLDDNDIDFTNSLETQIPETFAPPENCKTLLLPANKATCRKTLPEDCQYQPENLVKLFLLPNVLCLGKRIRTVPDNQSMQEDYEFAGAMPSCESESVLVDQCDRSTLNDVGDLHELVSLPRQVEKVEVQYDKTSKQVDVHALKEIMWDHIQKLTEVPGTVDKETLSFKQVLAKIPVDSQVAAPEGISPHLGFICLLHLANEHGLRISDCPTLDDLSIQASVHTP